VKNVQISSDLPVIVSEAVCFETGATRAQAADPNLFVYEHHGEGFGWADPGALTCFFEDVMHGRPLPKVFASKSLGDVDTLVALTLFKHPQLSVCPNALRMVTATDLIHRRGAVGMAHVDIDLARFVRFLRALFPKKSLPKRTFDEHLDAAVNYIHDYIGNDRLPHFGQEPEPPTVVETGSGGFVLAETAGSLGEAWVHLFRSGFVRGLVVGRELQGRRSVLGARKGPHIAFQLDMATRLLNEMELAMGELPDWKSDGLWLYGPPAGTLILVSHILQVLIRV
jgi:hypothetical protein